VAALRFLLSKWGVTVGQLAFANDYPTVQDCDTVILQGQSADYRDTCLGTLPDGAGDAAGPAAPLIFINSDQLSLETLPAAWLVLAQVDDDGANLRLALQSSFATARTLRGDPGGLVGVPVHGASDTYRHFLGHELRSPLTAIKTSLEVLAGDLGGLDSTGERVEPGLKMLAIALRNVRRLHKTVEWSQELLAAGASAPTPCIREVAVTELATHLQEFGAVRVDAAACDLDLQTDPHLVADLTTQMIRAVGMAYPDVPVTIELAVDPHDDCLFQLVVAAGDGEQGATPSIGRRALFATTNDGDEPISELGRLARFMVASPLIESLGADLKTSATDAGEAALVLTMTLQRETLPSF